MPPDAANIPTPPLTGDEHMRIRFAAADLAARLERMQGRIPADSWRYYAAKQIGDAIIAERNRNPLKR